MSFWQPFYNRGRLVSPSTLEKVWVGPWGLGGPTQFFFTKFLGANGEGKLKAWEVPKGERDPVFFYPQIWKGGLEEGVWPPFFFPKIFPGGVPPERGGNPRVRVLKRANWGPLGGGLEKILTPEGGQWEKKWGGTTIYGGENMGRNHYIMKEGGGIHHGRKEREEEEVNPPGGLIEEKSEGCNCGSFCLFF